MTREELVTMKKSAQRTRRETLKSLKDETNTNRERKSLIGILELAHKTIHLASLNIDLLDITS